MKYIITKPTSITSVCKNDLAKILFNSTLLIESLSFKKIKKVSPIKIKKVVIIMNRIMTTISITFGFL